ETSIKDTVSFQLPASRFQLPASRFQLRAAGFQQEESATGAGSGELAAGSYSLVSERLRRVELRGLPRRVNRRDETNGQRGDDDDGEVERLQDERHVRNLIDVDG